MQNAMPANIYSKWSKSFDDRRNR